MWHLPQKIHHPEHRVGILVADGKIAKLYVVHDDVIEEVSSLSFTEPERHGRQGFFVSRSRGIVMRSGTVDQYPTKKDTHRHFFNEVSNDLLRRRQQSAFDELYVFVAKPYVSLFKQSVHPFVAPIIKKIVSRDCVYMHPCELYKKMRGR